MRAGRAGLPWAGAGQSVGLLGGSFDPPHEGHLHLSRVALARFGLDWVWWLVSPGNPLKRDPPAPAARRVAAAAAIARHPRIRVTDIECHIGTVHTVATLAQLSEIFPRLRFVWLMGSDNLAGFHRWESWPEIMRHVPVGVVARPGSRLRARLSPAARAFAAARLPEAAGHALARHPAPAWCMVEAPLDPASSSAIRARGGWPTGVGS